MKAEKIQNHKCETCNSNRPTLKLHKRPPLPVNAKKFDLYVEQLLSPEEQIICCQATD